MTNLGSIVRGLAYAALERTFADEWLGLDSDTQELIAIDAVEAAESDGCTVREYRDRIGTGNLASYARCLSIQAKREQP